MAAIERLYVTWCNDLKRNNIDLSKEDSRLIFNTIYNQWENEEADDMFDIAIIISDKLKSEHKIEISPMIICGMIALMFEV